MKKFTKILSLLLAVITLFGLMPVTASAACSHSWTKIYVIENSNMHSYKSKCSLCGEVKEGWGYAGWENHSHDSSGVCVCGHKKQTCSHSSTTKVCKYENSNQHSYDSKCNSCGQTLSGWGYSGWESHSFSGNTCSSCGYTKSCSHSDNTRKYENSSSTQHKTWQHCNDCGINYNTTTASHSWDYGSWTSISDSQHKRTLSCVCGASKTETASHSFSGNTCTGCGYKKSSSSGGGSGSGSGSGWGGSAPSTASVTLSASGPSGTLGSAGGEITSESFPASYTVTASASGTTVTKIVYSMNGRTYTKNGSSVTITANKESEFTSTTFVAYTAAGISATFTVNFKYVRHATSYYMWNTYHEATIRSITGNGLNKTLSYSMTLPNSYDEQTNLSDDQVRTLLSLIRRADGKIYTVHYTRVIRVYSPASMTWNGQEIVHGYFDGNSDSEINTCISSWDWHPSTKEAIRQAAKSYLTFMANPVDGDDPVSPDCTAIWINTTTGRELYRTSDFHVSGTISASSSAAVSISYSDYSGSGSYVYDHLTYSGDTTGTSTSQTYSQNYSANSRPLTVTFYCHEQVTEPTSGSITVRAIDGETDALISSATVKLDSRTGSSNPATFSGVSFGNHTASASADGYSSASENVRITSSDPDKTVTLRLYRESGEVTVIVRDSSNRQTISGASVSGAGKSGETGSDGRVSFGNVAFGTHEFTASKSGYRSGSATATISKTSVSTTITIYLDPLPTVGEITVMVRDRNTGNVLSGATVTGNGRSRTTGSSGTTTFTNLSFGSYTFNASKSGYRPNSGTANITSDDPDGSVTIYLDPIPTTGDITVYVRDRETDALLSGVPVVSGSYAAVTGVGGAVTFSDLPFRTYTFTATKDEYSTGSASATISESNLSASVTIYLDKIKTDLSIRSELNGTLYKGSTVMVSARVFNDGDVDLTPSNPATVEMKARTATGAIFDTQSKSVIIPANGDNLVWYEVTIPDTTKVTFEFHVSAPAGVTETSLRNNDDSIIAPVEDLPERDCEDAGMEPDEPSGFVYTDTNDNEAEELTWTVWEWDGDFVRRTYYAKLVLDPELYPDETAGYREETGGVWTTRSGYGVDTEATADVDTNSYDVVGTTKVDVFFPEYAYSTAKTQSDRLELADGAYVFKVLPSSVSGARMHTVPLWFPDEPYAVKYYAFDVWCPAGMLTAKGNSRVVIDGDMYDDLYTN